MMAVLQEIQRARAITQRASKEPFLAATPALQFTELPDPRLPVHCQPVSLSRFDPTAVSGFCLRCC